MVSCAFLRDRASRVDSLRCVHGYVATTVGTFVSSHAFRKHCTNQMFLRSASNPNALNAGGMKTDVYSEYDLRRTNLEVGIQSRSGI